VSLVGTRSHYFSNYRRSSWFELPSCLSIACNAPSYARCTGSPGGPCVNSVILSSCVVPRQFACAGSGKLLANKRRFNHSASFELACSRYIPLRVSECARTVLVDHTSRKAKFRDYLHPNRRQFASQPHHWFASSSFDVYKVGNKYFRPLGWGLKPLTRNLSEY
jgi:hypothetical protein